MASSKAYLDFIIEQLSGLEAITYKAMMGEYNIAGLPHECYIDGIWNKEAEEDWLTEIHLPIEYPVSACVSDATTS